MPSLVAFLGSNSSTYNVFNDTVTNIIGGGNVFGTCNALTTIFNIGAGFYPGNGVASRALFTAPIAGNYWFIYNLSLNEATGGWAGNALEAGIVTTAKTYKTRVNAPIGTRPLNLQVTCCAPLLIGQTAYWYFKPMSHFGTQQVMGGANPLTWVAGYLM